MDNVYRIPLAGHDQGITQVWIAPSPYGDPYTVHVSSVAGYGSAAKVVSWVILPRDMFSDEVNRRTAMGFDQFSEVTRDIARDG